MKSKQYYLKQSFPKAFTLLALCFSVNFVWSQNLMLNPTCDDHGTGSGSTSDNADAYDMTPNNEILDELGDTIPSPYQAIWDNDDLEDWLEMFYLGSSGSLDEQPASTSDGNNGTRGIKLLDDGNPVITGCSRRIYQKVEGLTVGSIYTFSVESFSEATGTPSEIYILNTEIADEEGINANGASDAAVDGFLNVTNDFDTWTTSSMTFTATNSFAVVYIRSLNSSSDTTEVFYDNFSLVLTSAVSVEDLSAKNIDVYPNPASEIITIEYTEGGNIALVELYDVSGKQVIQTKLTNNTLNVSELPRGSYLLKIFSKNGNAITEKIVLE